MEARNGTKIYIFFRKKVIELQLLIKCLEIVDKYVLNCMLYIYIYIKGEKGIFKIKLINFLLLF